MAFNANGDLLIAYDRPSAPASAARHHFEARLFTTANELGPAQAIGEPPEGNASIGRPTLTAALAADRRALVGWNTLPCDELGCQEATLGVAIAEPGLHFGRPRTLARVRSNSWGNRPGPVLVAAGEDGRSTVAWNVRIGGRLVLVRAEVHGQRLNRRTRVSSGSVNAHAAALVTGHGGTTALLWREGRTAEDAIFSPARLMASVRVPGSLFGPAEVVTANLRAVPRLVRGQLAVEVPIAAAIDPVRGRVAAAWVRSSGANLMVALR